MDGTVASFPGLFPPFYLPPIIHVFRSRVSQMEGKTMLGEAWEPRLMAKKAWEQRYELPNYDYIVSFPDPRTRSLAESLGMRLQ